MQCAKCASTNAEDQKFCGQCGSPLAQTESAAPVPVPGEDGAYFCARHKKEVTRVRCGRCETPICTRCTVHGPAGVRCRACSRNKAPVRPMGVLHEVGRTLGDPNNGRQVVWYMVVFSFVMSFFSGIFGGNRD